MALTCQWRSRPQHHKRTPSRLRRSFALGLTPTADHFDWKNKRFHALQLRIDDGYCQHGACDSHKQQRGKSSAGDETFVQQDVDENDHDERFGLQQPSDDRGITWRPFEYFPGKVDAD